MKRLIVFLFILSSIMCTMIGCTGDDGDVYLAIYWTSDVEAYWDNNSGIPSYFSYGQKYKCSPGTYSYNMTAWKYNYYSGYDELYYYYGTYKLSANPGEFMKDGEDSYYGLYLDGYGVELGTSYSMMGENIKADTLSSIKKSVIKTDSCESLKEINLR